MRRAEHVVKKGQKPASHEQKPNRGRGRPPGSVNKFTKTAKDNFQECFKQLGGVPAFVKWARRNPDEFYKLYARLIPVEVSGTGEDGAIKIVISGKEAKF